MRLRIATALLAVFAVALLSSATSAFAANEIAYQCDLDICLLDPANPGAVTNLSDNGATSYDQTPIWSPDGKKVAFVSDFGQPFHSKWNIFVMEPGATDQAVNLAIQITHYTPEKAIDDLAWSPDGSRIAYTRGNNAGDYSVWVVTPTERRPSRWRSAGRAPSGTRPGPLTARRSPTPWSKTCRNRSTSRPRPAASARRCRTASGTNRTGRPTARRSPSTPTAPLATSTSISFPPTAAARR